MSGAHHAIVDTHGHHIPFSQRGPESIGSMISFGFWLFLLSDIVLFSGLFAAYAVLNGHTAGGPTGAQLFDLSGVFKETSCLLISSFTCGLMLIAAERGKMSQFYALAAVTWILGAAFIGFEVTEFHAFVVHGDGPTHSAFLSAFFTLVGTHGCHVTCGLLWLLTMTIQVATIGMNPKVLRRLFCFSLFWHALDLVWIGVFSIVYLGAFHAA